MAKIRVLIADDHTLLRESLRSLMSTANDIEVVGEAEDGLDAINKTAQLQPDIILMDIAMPNVNGLQATRIIRKQNPSTKVLVLTMYETEQYILEMLRVGASGYTLKKAPASELISAIRSTFQGNAFLSPSITRKVIDKCLTQIKVEEQKKSDKRLSTREIEVLTLIAEGKTNKEITTLLNISMNTVETHRLNLMKKLDIHDRTQLVLYAIREGLITP
jgi:two-component system, NarL family, response regulator NreC